MILDALIINSLRDRWRSPLAWQTGLVALVTIQMSVYPTVRDTSSDWEGAVESFPEAFREILRLEDYTSPAGYLSTELLSFVAPFIFMTLGASWGARVTSEDEESGTADIVFSLPITRRGFLVSHWLTGMIVLGATMVFLIAAFVFYSLAPLVGFFEAINPYNPLQWMLGARPLTSGVSIGYVVLLLALTTMGLVVSDAVFRRRDIRV